MPNPALSTLNSVFGYTAFRDNQAEVIQTLVNGGDALVLMPTGGGKSLCYQIPALLRDGVGIIISPLIALMRDQVSAVKALGIRADYLNSTQSHEQQRQVEQALLKGELDLIYIAPERLLKPYTLDLLSRSRLSLFAIDEAHCVSQWGHDFRKEYQQLRILPERFTNIPRIALTATADERTRAEIIEQLRLQDSQQYISSFDRPNIRYTIAEGGQAKQNLWRFLEQNHAEDAGIVYCLSRKKVNETAEWLTAQGRISLPYHAGLDAETRNRHQARFLSENSVIMVATIAFGMGIDKPDVRFVAHLNLPKSIEAYYQETGRAGRDSEPANAWMAYQLNDVITLRKMMQEADSLDRYKRIANQKLDAMLGLCESTQCRRQALLEYFGERHPHACGNCDNCLSPPQTWDGTEAAQKALSCVYRTGQRFGVTYVINVLRGITDDRIENNRHDRLSTFAIGKDMSANEWRSVLRQLIARAYLKIDEEGYGALHLTETCRALLKGDEEVELRRLVKPAKTARPATTRPHTDLSGNDQQLYDSLKDLRFQLALEQNVPPYVVFHDRSLHIMATERPRTLAKFSHISGVGEKKLERYGDAFVGLIKEHPTN